MGVCVCAIFFSSALSLSHTPKPTFPPSLGHLGISEIKASMFNTNYVAVGMLEKAGGVGLEWGPGRKDSVGWLLDRV